MIHILLSTANNLFVTPDLTAELRLTKDGRVRLVGFNKTNIDFNGPRKYRGKIELPERF